MKHGDIWGARDEPIRSPYDSPTRDQGIHEEMLWHLNAAKRSIDLYIGSGNQTCEEKAQHALDITESEYRMVMNPETYSGIDLVRVTTIGRSAWKFNLGCDLTRYIYEVKDANRILRELDTSDVIYDRLYERRYDKFTVNQLKELWEKIPDEYRTAEE
ncbi:MAG: hypothetical protein RR740_00720 [Pseudomonas sp.]